MKNISLIVVFCLALSSCSLFDNNNQGITSKQEPIDWPSLADSPWPMHAHDPQHIGRSTLVGASQGVVAWSKKLDYYIDSASPIIGGDGIYMGTARDRKSIFKLNDSGEIVWETALNGSVTSSPILSSAGNVYVPTSGYNMTAIHCLDINGNLIWQLETPTKNKYNYPVLDITGQYLFLILQNYILKINANTGIVTDSITVGGNVVYRGMSPAFSPDGAVFYVTGGIFNENWDSGSVSLFAFDTSGNHMWTFETGYYDHTFTTSYPSVNNAGTIFFQYSPPAPQHADYVYAINPDGSLYWQYEDDPGANLIFNGISIGNNGDLFFLTMSGYKLVSLDPEGNLRWEFLLKDIYNDPELSPFKFAESAPVIDKDDNLYVAMAAIFVNDTVNFAIFDKDGQLLSTLSLVNEGSDDPRDIYSMPAIGNDGSTYVATEDGGLFKVN